MTPLSSPAGSHAPGDWFLKHQWKQSQDAEVALWGSSTCSARCPSLTCVRTAKCNNAHYSQDRAPNTQALFRIRWDQRRGQTWPRPTGRCTERSLVKSSLRSTSATRKSYKYFCPLPPLSTMIQVRECVSVGGSTGKRVPIEGTVTRLLTGAALEARGERIKIRETFTRPTGERRNNCMRRPKMGEPFILRAVSAKVAPTVFLPRFCPR